MINRHDEKYTKRFRQRFDEIQTDVAILRDVVIKAAAVIEAWPPAVRAAAEYGPVNSLAELGQRIDALAETLREIETRGRRR